MNKKLIGELFDLANRKGLSTSFVTTYFSQFNHKPVKRDYIFYKCVLRCVIGKKR